MIVDTGPIYAVLDKRDAHHERCVRMLQTAPGPLIVPAPVIVEVCQLITSTKRVQRLGPAREKAFLHAVDSDYDIVDPTLDDRYRAGELVERYHKLDGGKGIGYVDAIVVAVAERLREHQVATLDRTHFSVITPNHVPRFELFLQD